MHDWSEGVAAWQCWPAHLVIDTCQHHKGRLCSAMAAFPGGPCTAKAALLGRPCTGRAALSGGLLCQVGAVLGLLADVASRYDCRLLGLIVQAGPSWQSLLHLTGCLHCVCMPSQHALPGMGMHGQGCCPYINSACSKRRLSALTATSTCRRPLQHKQVKGLAGASCTVTSMHVVPAA